MDSERRKTELIIQLERQRNSMDRSRSGLRKKLSLSYQLKRSIQENPRSWFLGSLGTATLAGIFFRRPRVVVKSAKRTGLLVSGVKMAFSAARPALSAWLISRAKSELEKRFIQQD